MRPRTNAGDPDRTLALLWRDPSALPRRGPRQSLTLDRVLDAALEIADADGLPALTMRRIAERLDVAAMTIYTYVPGKAELLDLLLDHAYRTMDVTGSGSATRWRERCRDVADRNRAFFTQHPWAIDVSTHRPSLGPGQLAKYEHELHAFDGAGLSDVERDDALAHLLAFVRQHARGAREAAEAASSSALTDQQWWDANEPLLRRVLDPREYPLATRVGSAAGAAHGSAWDAEHAWEFGLERTLDGLAALGSAGR